MKKVIFFICSVFITLLTSCNDISVKSNEEDFYDSRRKEVLAFYAENGNYIASQNEIESNLYSFALKSKNDRSLLNADEYRFELKTSDCIEVSKDNHARSANVDSYDDVNLYLYDVLNTNTGSRGYAITSDDKRIGTVLAFIPEGSIGESGENPFFELFVSNLEEYIDDTVECWNDLTDEDINFRKASNSSIISSGDYTFSDWKYNSGNESCILKTKWGQRYPYNLSVNNRINDGNDYPAGCGPVALAQIFAHLEYPSSYDWAAMKLRPYADDLNSTAMNMVADLMSDLGIGLNASYKTTGTGCYNSDVEKYLKKNGYSYSGFKNYDFDAVQNSIDNGSPVMTSGYATKKTKKKKFMGITFKKTTTYSNGHFWVIDGYARFSCKATHKKSGEVVTLTDNFIHCNLGWDGYCNGYYLNGLFDTQHVPLEYINGNVSSSGKGSHNFQYKQTILTNISHD